METRLRTVVKSLVWTLIGLVVMAATGFFFTGSLAVGGAMAAINAAAGFATYMVYERLWDRVTWGRHG